MNRSNIIFPLKSKAIGAFSNSRRHSKQATTIMTLDSGVTRAYSTNKRITYTPEKPTDSFNAGNNDQNRDTEYSIGKGLSLFGEMNFDFKNVGTQKEIIISQSRNLIEYFSRLSSKESDNEQLNLEFVESLIRNGADINCSDKYGQTVMHEASRIWDKGVALFLIEHGANINCVDRFGRTPLHISAAVDYADMVKFLVQNGALISARTTDECQTPIHFAAKNDAVNSLKMLITLGAEYINIFDYKNRTPLHLAGELDRSETSRTLLQLEPPAKVTTFDDSGQSAISCMIIKMPQVALIALDQFHRTDRANRRQYYHINKLDIPKIELKPSAYPKTALQLIVGYNRHDLVLHPVIQELIRVKWKLFGLNLLDWLVYLMLIICVMTHIIDVTAHNIEVGKITRFNIRFSACTLVFLWIRLMKFARAYSAVGPFIVMLGHMVKDFFRFMYLYMQFFIPYACAFWMIFGGVKVLEEHVYNTPILKNQTVELNGWKNPAILMWTLFRITLVDEYNYDALSSVDSAMAAVMVISWIVISSIIFLNLFIALMSDSFQRVYDNARANAIMQKAITIVNIEENLNKKKKERFKNIISTEYGPEICDYDDDDELVDLSEFIRSKASEERDSIQNDGSDTHYIINQVNDIQTKLNEIKASNDSIRSKMKKEIFNIKSILNCMMVDSRLEILRLEIWLEIGESVLQNEIECLVQMVKS
ncbi:hypothetical protein A3Q56_00136 [Intoshia linei]|uniref:Ion transport domain-containing protein n=1 Tax=Intoshia linei TaxID=1819745 RepID=A0A177BEU2_9BILA|nr:hypothetical protein A3Q56_00136 [Intoshia linei]